MIKTNDSPVQEFTVVHPMFDVEEQKHDGTGLGQVKLSRTVRAGLVLLRVYVIAVALLLAFHVLLVR